jgi:hypothetical protein
LTPGHIAYYVRRIAGGVWLMKSVERNADLDDITEEDIEEGALNDDQLQAVWGRTLYEALRTHDAIVDSELGGQFGDEARHHFPTIFMMRPLLVAALRYPTFPDKRERNSWWPLD